MASASIMLPNYACSPHSGILTTRVKATHANHSPIQLLIGMASIRE
jgi:hypothetical protein